MRTSLYLATVFIPLSFLGSSGSNISDEFSGIRCGSDVSKALIGCKVNNERVVVIEERHIDIGLKDLGGYEVSDVVSLAWWRICGDEYVLLEKKNTIQDVLKLPSHSKEYPEFLGSCLLNGKETKGVIIAILVNKEGSDLLSARVAWRIDEHQAKFISLSTEGMLCPRDGISTSDGGH